LLEQMAVKIGAKDCGAERLETPEAKAERIIAAELKRRKWG